MFAKAKFFLTLPYHSLVRDPGPFLLPEDYPDLTDQVWIVTGATSGIGFEIAKILLKQHAKVYILGRSAEKLEEHARLLRQEFPSEAVDTLIADYADLNTIKPAATDFKCKETKLNGIFHNAGVMNVPRHTYTKQGIEMTIGVNNVATQYLQDLLDPLIIATPKARIVWLSSLGHIAAPQNGFNSELIDKLSPEGEYAMSKAVDYIQAVQWSKRHPEADTLSLAVHPGVIKSELTRTTSSFLKTITAPFTYDTPYGALAPIYAGLAPNVENNDYIVPFGRPGPVRPDIYEAARNESGEQTVVWLENQIHANLTP